MTDQTGTPPTGSPAGEQDGPAGSGPETVADGGVGGPVAIPGGRFLLDADYGRDGDDLLLSGPGGETMAVPGYFGGDGPADLVSDGGTYQLPGAVVEQLAQPVQVAQAQLDGAETSADATQTQLAQAQTAQAIAPIGTVELVKGTVTALRQDGSEVALGEGDAVFANDTINSGGAGGVTLRFNDDTEFQIGSNAEMVLDQFVYNPATASGEMSFSLVKGAFRFISGQVAKSAPDAMEVKLPVATIGIRGTSVATDANSGEVTLLPNPDGTVGAIAVSNATGQTIMSVPGATVQATGFTTPLGPQVILSTAQINARYQDVAPGFGGQVLPEGQQNTPQDSQTDQQQQQDGDQQDGDQQAGGQTVDDPNLTDITIEGAKQAGRDVAGDETDEDGEGDGEGDGDGSDELDLTLGLEDEGEGEEDEDEDEDDEDDEDETEDDEEIFFFEEETDNSGDDVIFGTTGPDSLDGGGGNDALFGLAGNDELLGGADSDLLDGGTGADTMYGESGNDIYIVDDAGDMVSEMDLTAVSGVFDAGGYDQVIASISYTLPDFVEGLTLDGAAGAIDGTGNTLDNYIVGNTAANNLDGLAGNDTLDGSGGNDTLTGGLGDDVFRVTEAGDVVNENAGEGTDKIELNVSYTLSANVENADIYFNAGLTQIDIIGNAENNVINDLGGQANSIDGGAGNDTIQSTGGNDTISGGTGTDTLLGGAGNDRLIGWNDGDVLDGGSGFDTVDYSQQGGALHVDLSSGTFLIGGSTGADSLLGIEGIVGTSGADTLAGDAGSQSFAGGGGNDLLVGRGGADTLDGGAGTDTADYSDSGAGVSIDLIGGTGFLGDAAGDVLSSIERVVGSGFADTLVGSTATETFEGGAGDDLFDAADGGGDSFDGGAGLDEADYAAAITGVAVDLSDTASFNSVEAVFGSAFADTLSGTTGSDRLFGYMGDDQLNGSTGLDTLDGGAGLDIYQDLTAQIADSGGDDGDVLDIQAGGYDFTAAPTAGESFSGIEVIDMNSAGTVTLDAASVLALSDTGSVQVDGSAGDFVATSDSWNLVSGSTMIGGNAYSKYVSGGATLYVQNTVDQAGIVATLSGDAGPNNLVGTSANELIDGLAGDDTIDGAGGNDTLIGGTGDDDLLGGAGDDLITVDSANDSVDGGAGTDTVEFAFDVDLGALATSGQIVGVEAYAVTGGFDITGDAAGNTLTGGDGNNILDGAGGGDDIVGGAGNDTLLGGTGADTLDGGVGNDSVDAGAGDDLIIGSSGADQIAGGSGIDEVDYFFSGTGVSVDLGSGGPQGGPGDSLGDVLSGIERVIGSTHGDTLGAGTGQATLSGDAGDDFLTGGTVADSLSGGTGSDLIEGGAGGDTLDGGGGNDLLDYSGSGTGVTVDLLAGTAIGGDATGDMFANFEGVGGSAYNDSLAGDGNANSLVGGAGADTLIGNGGSDTLAGGLGNDVYRIGSADTATITDSGGNDTIELYDAASSYDVSMNPGAGIEKLLLSSMSTVTLSSADILAYNAGGTLVVEGDSSNTVNGGGGADAWTFGGYAADPTGGDGVFAQLTNGGATLLVDPRLDTSGIVVDITGTGGNDLLVGTPYNDSVDGQGGNDTILGSAGADSVVGGAGADVMSYAASASGVTVDLGTNVNTGGDAEGDDLSGIEILIGTDQADTLTGDALDNTIAGGAGGDFLSGGGGFDALDYEDSLYAVSVSLQSATASGGDAAGDSLSADFEAVIGGWGADTLDGDAGANALIGNAGNDVIEGRGGADTIDGGDGYDAVSYYNATVGVQIDLTAGTQSGSSDEAGDVLTGIEHVVGSDSGNDFLYGTAGNNSLFGAGGDDEMIGGAGNDTFAGGNGTDLVDYSTSTPGVTVDMVYQEHGGSAAGDYLTSIERLRGTSGDDTFITSNDISYLMADQGDDTVVVRDVAATSTLYGGADTDTLDASRFGHGISIIADGSLSNGGDTATIGSFERFIASAGDDTLADGSGMDSFSGGAGDDDYIYTVDGGSFDGGTGFDELDLSGSTSAMVIDLDAGTADPDGNGMSFASVEAIVAGTGTDTIHAGTGYASIDGGAGDDLISSGGGDGDFNGGAGIDTISYAAAGSGIELEYTIALKEGTAGEADGDFYTNIERFVGSAFDDVFVTDLSGVLFEGGAGDDLFDIGVGSTASVSGGAGTDTLSFEAVGGGVTINIAADTVIGGYSGDFDSIENIVGSGFGDVLIGDGGGNLISGGSGADSIVGGAGGDTLLGGGLSDTIVGGLGDDSLAGGSDIDTLDYSAAVTGVDVDLQAGVALIGGETDQIDSFEDVIGSTGADTLAGAATGYVTLDGGDGDDLLISTDSMDSLAGGSGNDTVSYENASAGVTVDLMTNTVDGDAFGDWISGIENVIGSDFDDSLIGGTGGGSFDGGAGDDWFEKSASGVGDTIAGGSGLDIVDYGAVPAATGVTVDLSNNSNNTGAAQFDLLTGVEGVFGTTFADTLIGTAGTEYLHGNSGDDSLLGGGGADSMDGGGGADVFGITAADFATSHVTDTGGGAQLDTLRFTTGGLVAGDTDLVSGGQYAGIDVIDLGNLGNEFGLNADIVVSLPDAMANQLVITGGSSDSLSGGAGWTLSSAGVTGASIDPSLSGTFDLYTSTVAGPTAMLYVEQGIDVSQIILGDGASDADDMLTADGSGEWIFAFDGDDVVYAGSGPDTLGGGAGDDLLVYDNSVLEGVSIDLENDRVTRGDADGDIIAGFEHAAGGMNNDLLLGSSGVNSLSGGGGSDTIDGGAGADWVSFEDAASNVILNLTEGLGGESGAQDLLVNVENVVGSAYDDALIGDDQNNYLDGWDGDDSFLGGEGADTLVGGDAVFGDWASYHSSLTGVTVNLDAGTGAGGDAAGDILWSIEGLRGSDRSDTLIGDSAANSLYGAGGSDVIEGLGGADTIVGGTAAADTVSYENSGVGVDVDLWTGIGNYGDAQGDQLYQIDNAIGSAYDDTLYAGSGAGSFDGGAGDDLFEFGSSAFTVDGGSGSDTVSFIGSPSGMFVDLSLGIAETGPVSYDLLNVENVNGSGGEDLIIGDGLGNWLDGGGGNDTLLGGLGNDTLDGGGGTGDYASYENAGSAVTVDLGAGTATGGDGDDLLIGIERVIGSDFADAFHAGDTSETLLGGDGDDTLVVGAGATGTTEFDGGDGFDLVDWGDETAAISGSGGFFMSGTSSVGLSDVEGLIGGTGDDMLEAGNGVVSIAGGGGDDQIAGSSGAIIAETLDGGAGIDSLTIAGSSGSVVDLSNSANNAGDAAGDVYTNFENVIGSGGDDHITGDAGDNLLDGLGGYNTLVGGGGADTLDGTLGTDVADYSGAGTGVAVDLFAGSGSAGEADGDELINIEGVIGSAYADTLSAGSGETLFGEGGDDLFEIDDNASTSTFYGGAGTDTADFGEYTSGFLTVDLGGGTGSNGIMLSEIEDVAGSIGDDTITGSDGANALEGRLGDDSLEGAGGADTLIGGFGQDTASYQSSTGGVTVDLDAGTGAGGDAQGDILSGIENLSGSSYDDVLAGDFRNNSLSGGSGDDTLIGAGGDDTIAGGTGFDIVDYSASSFGVAIDLGSSELSGAAGGMVFGVEGVVGTAHDDWLIGDGAFANSIAGGAGNDTLSGGQSAATGNTLAGGAGDDVYRLYQTTDFAQTVIDETSGTDSLQLGFSGGVDFGSLANVEDFIAQVDGIEVLDIGAGGGFSNAVTLTSAVIDGITDSGTLRVDGNGDDALAAGGGWTLSDPSVQIGTDYYVEYTRDGLTLQVDVDIDRTGIAVGDTPTNVGDSLVLTAGNDSVDLLTGNDTVEGGAGSDTLMGGADTDAVSYAGSSAAVTVDINSNTASGGDAAGDVISGFEIVIGSSFADTLTFGGTQTAMGGGGGDAFIGSAGQAFVSYAGRGAVSVDLGAGTGGAAAAGDTYTTVYGVIGSDFADTLVGGTGSATLFGGAGDDDLVVNFVGGEVDGGAGTDTLDLSSLAIAASVDMTTGTASGIQFDSIERIVTGTGTDTLTGSTGADYLDGGDNHDRFIYSGGDDTLVGSGGRDEVDYSGSGLSLQVDLSAGTAVIGGDTQMLSGIEVVRGGTASDTLTGDAGANSLAGDAGDDLIEGAGDGDTLDGDLGTDILSYAGSGAAVMVDLSTNAATGGDATGDVISGFEGVIGSGFGDSLTASALGSGSIGAGAGNDTVIGGSFADTMDGGAGIDTLDYSQSGAGVDVYLALEDQSFGHAAGDVVRNFERLVGSSSGDTLSGLYGSDTIAGGSGDDIIHGTSGADSLDGGAGTDDLLSYGSSTAGVTVDLGADTATGGHAAGDSIANFEQVEGSAHDDTLIGASGTTSLLGGAGYDLLVSGLYGGGTEYLAGGAGTDTVSYTASTTGVDVDLSGVAAGGAAQGDMLSGIENLIGSGFDDTLAGDNGANSIAAGAGNDVVGFSTGSTGSDTLDGGTGFDLLDASLAGFSSGSVFDLDDGSVFLVDGSGGTVHDISGFEGVVGTGYRDSLVGDSGANSLDGGGDNDSFYGGAGNDTIHGGSGGTNWVTYALVAGGIAVDLGTGVATDGLGGTDQLSNIQVVEGSDTGGDTLTGGTGSYTLSGGGGSDSLVAGGGAGELYGGAGSDTLMAGTGTDYLDGGAGDDLYVQTASGPVTYHEDVTGGTDTLESYVDVIGLAQNIENLTLLGGALDGTGNDGNNLIIGNSGANSLSGLGGSDTLQGGAGNDTLDGGDGLDSLIGGTGDDVYHVDMIFDRIYEAAGEGYDTVLTSTSFILPAEVEVLDGSAATDSMTLTGNDQANSIVGGASIDIISGGLGNDTISGGGTDSVIYELGDGDDLVLNGAGALGLNGEEVDYARRVGNDFVVDLTDGATITIEDHFAGSQLATVVDFDGGEVLDVQTGTIGGFADEVLVADDGVDSTLDGGDGDDVLYAGLGDDSIAGGTGYDEIVMRTGANTADGGFGDDLIEGGAGNESIAGGLGFDEISGGAGNDTLNGGYDFDVSDLVDYSNAGSGVKVDFTAGLATDGDGGTDSISDFEMVRGSLFNDTLAGGSGLIDNDSGDWEAFAGLEGNDLIDGGNGAYNVAYYSDDRFYGGTSGVRVDLGAGVATDGFGDTDTLINGINRVRGTIYNDSLAGSAGGTSVEVFRALGGNDTIDGGAGGNNEVRYDRDYTGGGLQGAHVDLGSGLATDGNGDVDQLTNIDRIRGTGTHDTLIGSTGDEVLRGLGGDDVIMGVSGSNWLEGGDGFDSVLGGSGDDTLVSGAGEDTYDGGSGATYSDYDTLDFSDAGALIAVHLGNGVATDSFGDTDLVANIEEVTGSAYFDFMVGGGTLGDTNDFERFRGLAGGDNMDGGFGYDEVDYAYDDQYGGSTGVYVDLTIGNATDGFGDTDILAGFESVRGTNYADTIIGGAGISSNYDDFENFRGLGGNDSLVSGGGLDNRVDYSSDEYFGGFTGVTVDLDYGVATDGFGSWDSLSGGFDRARGTTFADTLYGSSDDNKFEGNGGADSIDGYMGQDQIRYHSEHLFGGTAGISVDLAGGTAIDTFGDTDTFTSIEDVRGSVFDDQIFGDANANVLEGRDGDDLIEGRDGHDALYGEVGNDTLAGGTGEDFLVGGEGADSIDGGAGYDVAAYYDDQAGVYVDLQTGTAAQGGLATDGSGSVDTLYGISDIRGSMYDDTLIGGDQLTHNDDFINFGVDFESFMGLEGNDVFETGGITVGNGQNRLDYSRDDQFGGSVGVRVDLSSGVATDGFGDTDTFTATASDGFDDVRGTNYADSFVGGLAINDDFEQFRMLGGNDTVDGGSGFDRVRYDQDASFGGTAGVRVNLLTGTATDGFGDTDMLLNIEGVRGSNSGDSIGGGSGADVFQGRGGNDYLYGYSGDDDLRGEDGGDTVNGGSGNDTLTGGTGADWFETSLNDSFDTDHIADWDSASDQLLINGTGISNFAAFESQITATGGISDDGTDVTLTINTGSGLYTLVFDGVGTGSISTLAGLGLSDANTWITGDDVGSNIGNSFTGNAGADRYAGMLGDDTIGGLAGNDTLFGGLGHDEIDGGNGDDSLDGGVGDDSIFGGSGADALIGGEGFDTLEGGIGADELHGGVGNDSLSAGSGSDTLDGGAGGDTLAGGDGMDWASYDSASSAVTADLGFPGGNSGDAAGDTFASIENLLGSSHDDYLYGDGGVNHLDGNAGDDFLDGYLGDDTMTGGAGADTFGIYLDDSGDTDYITDWNSAFDSLSLSGTGVTSFSDFEALVSAGSIVDDSTDVTITVNTGGGNYSLVFEGQGSGGSVDTLAELGITSGNTLI